MICQIDSSATEHPETLNGCKQRGVVSGEGVNTTRRCIINPDYLEHLPLPASPPALHYSQVPKLLSLEPSRGSRAGGTRVSISGQHLDTGSQVRVMVNSTQECTILT